ncbi:MAG: hypothetical protein HGN29_18010 [Asgard group archaeon]|nr:hypothetical protein [Asgard group archaeon]
MAEKKKSRGRPRIYKDDAEKQKAFREKKKEEFETLLERFEKLEAITNKDFDKQLDEKQPWFDWTYQDIKKMSTKDLQDFKKELEKALGKRSIHSPLKVIVGKALGEIKTATDSLIRHDVLRSARSFDNALFNATILQLINIELGNRISEFDFDQEIEIAEQRISELEAEIKDKKKQQIKTVKQS